MHLVVLKVQPDAEDHSCQQHDGQQDQAKRCILAQPMRRSRFLEPGGVLPDAGPTVCKPLKDARAICRVVVMPR